MRNNSLVSQHGVGILLKAGAKLNEIGDARGWGNQILGNKIAGIKIEGATASSPARGNRIIGNYVFNSGFQLPSIPDPMTEEPQAVNILLINATNQMIGGNRPSLGNGIYRGGLGIAIVGGSGNLVQNNFVGGTFHSSPAQTDRLSIAAALIRDSVGNQFGPGNTVNGGGFPDNTGLGGLVIRGGRDNMIVGNKIGAWRDDSVGGNDSDGIVIINSAGNRIGGPGNDANVIVNSTGYGIVVQGSQSVGNHIAGNHIGVPNDPLAPPQPNSDGGILLESGARNTLIGGDLPLALHGAVVNIPVSNRIIENGGDGIRVDGGTTTRNTILNNEISGNSGLGINLLNGGNTNQASPSLEAEPGLIKGSSNAPDGSIIQVFLDPAGEGRVFLGEFPLSGGSFTVDLPAFVPSGLATATVTNITTGATSEFSTPTTVEHLLDEVRIRRTTGLQTARKVSANTQGVVLLPITVESTVDAPIEVSELVFQYSGEANAFLNPRLYNDLNGNGQIDIDEGVSTVSVVIQGSAYRFTGLLGIVSAGKPVHLILAGNAGDTAGNGGQFSVQAASSAKASMVFGPSVPVGGSFPVRGDTISIIPPINSYEDWQLAYFSPEEIASTGKRGDDPNGNGVPNFVEYAAGTDPRALESSPVLRVGLTSATYYAVFTLVHRPDADLILEESTDAVNWTEVPPSELEEAGVDPEGKVTVLLERDPPQAPQFLRLRARSK